MFFPPAFSNPVPCAAVDSPVNKFAENISPVPKDAFSAKKRTKAFTPVVSGDFWKKLVVFSEIGFIRDFI